MNKKAQARMMETIVILFIFFVLISFSALFYVQYQKSAMQEKREELLLSRAMDASLLFLFMPELTCTKGAAEVEDNCFDVLKLNHIYRLLDKQSDYYFHQFSFAKVYVDKIYPEIDGDDLIDCEGESICVFEKDLDGDGQLEKIKRWIIYNKEMRGLNEEGERTTSWTNREQTPFIVTLRDETNEEVPYSLGILTIEVFS